MSTTNLFAKITKEELFKEANKLLITIEGIAMVNGIPQPNAELGVNYGKQQKRFISNNQGIFMQELIFDVDGNEIKVFEIENTNNTIILPLSGLMKALAINNLEEQRVAEEKEQAIRKAQETILKEKEEKHRMEQAKLKKELKAKELDKRRRLDELERERDNNKIRIENEVLQNGLIDIDGNRYATQRIGSQIFMARNLNVSRFKNGDTIPELKTAEEWIDAGRYEKPGWCYFDNDPENGAKVGKLYNWYAVMDARGLAPNGWHIPSVEEYDGLQKSLGGDAGVAYKALLQTYNWERHNDIFVILEGGTRSFDASASFLGHHAMYWTTTPHKIEKHYACSFGLVMDFANTFHSPSKACGLAVRCVFSV